MYKYSFYYKFRVLEAFTPHPIPLSKGDEVDLRFPDGLGGTFSVLYVRPMFNQDTVEFYVEVM